MSRADSERDRRIASLVEIGTISQVDHKLHRYRVKVGELETDWSPTVVPRAGNTKTYETRDVGEQVLIASVGGDMTQAVIVGSISTEEKQPANKGRIHRTVYPDGTTVDYDDDGGMTTALAEGRSQTTTVGGVTFVTSQDGVSITVGGFSFVITSGGLEMAGGQITHDGRNIGSTHVHGGVTPGGGDTSLPH